MDDTNPTKEEVEYVESIIADVQWLIGGWADDARSNQAAVRRANGTPGQRRR